MAPFVPSGGLDLNLTTTTPILPATTSSSRSFITYIVAATGSSACYLHCSSDELFFARAMCAPGSFKAGMIYCLRWSSSGRPIFSKLPDQAVSNYLDRGGQSFVDERYESVVLKALLLGQRVRDYERSVATVISTSPLILSMRATDEFLADIRFKSVETGEELDVRIDGVKRRGDAMRLHCSLLTNPLNSGSLKNSSLLIPIEGVESASLVTWILQGVLRRDRPILNREFLNRAYGEESTFSLGKPKRLLISIGKDGGDIVLNAEISEVVHRYNDAECPGFVVDAPPGPAKNMAIAASVVRYRGPGLQIIVGASDAVVFEAAATIESIDHSGIKIHHIVSSDVEERLQMKSPFSTLDSEDKENRFNVILGKLDRIMQETVKHKVAGAPCEIQQQLERDVRRVIIIDDITEADLNAIVHLYPNAKPVVYGHIDHTNQEISTSDVGSQLADTTAFDLMKRKKNFPCVKLRLALKNEDPRPRYRDAPPTLHRSVYSNSNYEHYALLSSLNKEYSHRAAQPRVVEVSPPVNTENRNYEHYALLSSLNKEYSHRAALPRVVEVSPAVNAENLPPFNLTNIIGRIGHYCENVTYDSRRHHGFFKEEDMAALHYISMKLRMDGYAKEDLDVVYYTDKLVLVKMQTRAMKARQGRTKYEVTNSVSPQAAALFSAKKSLKDKETGVVILGSEAIRRTAPWQQLVSNGHFVAIAPPASK